jgi:hypothetical protein
MAIENDERAEVKVGGSGHRASSTVAPVTSPSASAADPARVASLKRQAAPSTQQVEAENKRQERIKKLQADAETWHRNNPGKDPPIMPTGAEQSKPELRIGMTKEELRAALGEPDRITVISARYQVEAWTYGTTIFHFREGKLEDASKF